MAEPGSTVVGIAGGAAVGASLTIVGAQVDALAVGLFAAILISIWMRSIDSPLKSFAAIAMSSLLSGYGARLAALQLAQHIQGVQPEDVRLFMALVIGAASPTIIPIALRRLGGAVESGGVSK